MITGSLCDSADSCQHLYLTFNLSDIDYIYMSKIWGIAFSSVLSLYLVALAAGIIIKFVKGF